MKFTLKVKMTLMGAGVTLALCILGGVILWSNSVVDGATGLADLRNKQLNLTKDMKFAQTTLLLAAMDSIIDKSEGIILPERMEDINKNAEFLIKNADALKDAADTQLEIVEMVILTKS